MVALDPSKLSKESCRKSMAQPRPNPKKVIPEVWCLGCRGTVHLEPIVYTAFIVLQAVYRAVIGRIRESRWQTPRNEKYVDTLEG